MQLQLQCIAMIPEPSSAHWDCISNGKYQFANHGEDSAVLYHNYLFTNVNFPVADTILTFFKLSINEIFTSWPVAA